MQSNSTDLIIAKLGPACRLLAEARDVKEVKHVVDLAKAAEVYAKRQHLGQEAEEYARTLKMDATALLGDFLSEAPKNKGIDGAGPGRGNKRSTLAEPRLLGVPTLASAGLNKKESATAQAVAELKKTSPEVYESVCKGKQSVTAAVKKVKKEKKRKQARRKQRDGCTVKDLQTLVDGGEVFGTIYADPPWQYSNRATRAAADGQYDTMSVEQIAALPVGQLADKQAHLHLWTTTSFIREALGIIEAWGFAYKSMFVWCKEPLGIGNYWRVSHEILLLGVRGSCEFLDNSLKSWAVFDRAGHSEKPAEARAMIEKASPPARLELFGRKQAEGWTVWGNEIAQSAFASNGGSNHV